ncbi:MAG: hypothetical protein F6K39_37665 [Okeania sp. SIO3B3]|nr:hypothetical protein [Okeania sp. SIO3B3]
MLKSVYDINPNYLGVRSQDGRKKKKPRAEGESFLARALNLEMISYLKSATSKNQINSYP